MIMQHHKPECLAEILIHCLECQGHSDSLYYQNMTINCWSICKQTGSYSTASEAGCPVEKLDYCVQGDGHSEDSICQ